MATAGEREDVDANAAGRSRWRLPGAAALRFRDFRLFWLGYVTEVSGQQMLWVAQGWLIYELSGSAVLLGAGMFPSPGCLVEKFYFAAVETTSAYADLPHSNNNRLLHLFVAATLLAAWHADGRVVSLGTSTQETATVLEGDRVFTETDRSPYAWGQKFGRRDEDLHAVDIGTGARKKLLDVISFANSLWLIASIRRSRRH